MLRRGHLRLNRRNIGGGPRFSPADIAGLVAWYDAAKGITTVDAAVVDGTDVSTANWTAGGIASRTATTVTEDGTTGLHRVYQTPTNSQMQNATVTFDVKYVSGAREGFGVYFGSTSYVIVNAVAGTLPTKVQCTASIEDLGTGWFRVTANYNTVTAHSILQFQMWDSVSGLSYAGDGASTMGLTNISITQRFTSAWADQSGTGDANKHLAQATAGNQPLYNATDSNLNGKPSLTFSEARPDRMASGTWTTANPTGSTYLIVGCHSTTRDSTAWPYMDSADGTGTNRQATYALTSNQLLTFGSGTDVASTTAVPAGVVPFVIAVTYGASGKLWWKAKTAIKTGNSGTQTLPSLRLGGNAVLTPNVYFDGSIAEVIAYNTALSQANVEALLTWAGAKYGISIGV